MPVSVLHDSLSRLNIERGYNYIVHLMHPAFVYVQECYSIDLPNRLPLYAVYDITIGYRYNCPSFMDNAFGVDPSEVHIHIRRVSLSDIPTSEDQISEWLMNAFKVKDEMLSNFYEGGHFPCEGTELGLSTLECVFRFVFVLILTGTCTYLTFFSSLWFKLYVSLVCAFLASATYFNIRPSPIFVR